MVIDNAGFHSLNNLKVPDNIIIIALPAYSPELNPAERVWPYLKDKIAMTIFDSAKHLEDMLESMIKKLDNELIKSLVGL